MRPAREWSGRNKGGRPLRRSRRLLDGVRLRFQQPLLGFVSHGTRLSTRRHKEEWRGNYGNRAVLGEKVLCAGPTGVLMMRIHAIAIILVTVSSFRLRPGVAVMIMQRILPKHQMQVSADAERSEQQESRSGEEAVQDNGRA